MRSYTWTKRFCSSGLTSRAKPRGVHPRSECVSPAGMMLFQMARRMPAVGPAAAGSDCHAGRCDERDLSLFLVDEEGHGLDVRGLRETMSGMGCFLLYTPTWQSLLLLH